jgi:hypothetical protein
MTALDEMLRVVAGKRFPGVVQQVAPPPQHQVGAAPAALPVPMVPVAMAQPAPQQSSHKWLFGLGLAAVGAGVFYFMKKQSDQQEALIRQIERAEQSPGGFRPYVISAHHESSPHVHGDEYERAEFRRNY